MIRPESRSLVDGWLASQLGGEFSRIHVVEICDLGLQALWRRASVTLGEVTLSAIAERILIDVSDRHPAAEPLELGSDGFSTDRLRQHLDASSAEELRAALGDVIASLLSLVGALTAEILTPALEKELSRVALPDHSNSPPVSTGSTEAPADAGNDGGENES